MPDGIDSYRVGVAQTGEVVGAERVRRRRLRNERMCETAGSGNDDTDQQLTQSHVQLPPIRTMRILPQTRLSSVRSRRIRGSLRL